MADIQLKLQNLSNEYQQIQDDLQTNISARQKLESQQEENRAVAKEFKTLSADSNVYKLVGPVLLQQDKNEAQSTVDGRLEFIDKEVKRVEGAIKELQGKGDRVRGEIGSLQQQLQLQQQEQEQGQGQGQGQGKMEQQGLVAGGR